MEFINILTKETIMPTKIGSTFGITWENSKQELMDLGWRIKPDLAPILEGFERLSLDYVDGIGCYAQAVYTDTLIQDRLNYELEEAQKLADAAEEQAILDAQNLQEQAILDAQNLQMNKIDELKITENNFLLICEQLTGVRQKLGFSELETIIEGLMLTNPNEAIVLSIRLLTINSAGLRLGGLMWYDTCEWHSEMV